MLVVCLDSNAVDVDRPLESNAHFHLLEAGGDGRLGVCVPRLVLDEVLNKWREKVVALDAERRKQEARLVDIGALDGDARADELDIDEAVSRRRQLLEERLEDANAFLPGLPDVSHDQVVGRALARSQPFDAEGKDGYRDVLLWETILDLVAEGHDVVFISRDKKAFFEGRQEERLSAVLAAEAKERGGDPKR